ncbi:MAG: S1/P1 nuclease [Verrucomicrobiota bacterium]
MVKTLLCSLLVCLVTAASVFGYGPDGHHIVGAIADERLANTPTGQKVAQILDGMTLREAAQVPDTIKGWDKKGVEDPKNAGYFSSRPRIAGQLRAFWSANQPMHDQTSPIPSHHWFHYTDVPVEAAKYSAGKVGRSQWDIVHMITYCVGVLRGEIPEGNPRKITKAVAIILLAHYLGDIHQPLHVGAQYFDQSGQKINPDLGQPYVEDQGGNSISLQTSDGGKGKKLHGFWDSDTVAALFPGDLGVMEKDERKVQMGSAEKEVVHKFATQEPAGWRMPAAMDAKNYAEAWADEILPIARAAHERLLLQSVTPTTQKDGGVLAVGTATEKPMPDNLSYRDWAARVVAAELPKAGWRLADLLQKCLVSTTVSTAPAAAPSAAASVPATSPSEFSQPQEVPVAPPPITPIPALTPLPTATSIYGNFPANYKEIITSWLKTKLNNPADPKIEWQTEPKPADLPGAGGRKIYGYLVLFSTNDRGRPGKHTRAALIRDGRVVVANGFDR